MSHFDIKFYGAAGEVTGSKHLVTVAGKRILLDCGLFQGRREESAQKNHDFPFECCDVDAVILSHAHIDHCGLLPLLVKNGYSGPIYTSAATADILHPMLDDSAHIQESDAKYARSKFPNEALQPIEPLYTKEDAEAVHPLVVTKPRGEDWEIFPGITVHLYNAGHVLGSAQVTITYDGETLGFTGDLGRKNRKILKDPVLIPRANVLITEATYGDRQHPEIMDTQADLEQTIIHTAARGGKIIIPSFALERTQELLYDLHQLFIEQRIPEIPVFVDSPLAIKFTEIFTRHDEAYDEHARDFFVSKGNNPFSFERLKMTRSVEESKKLNTLHGPAIIIASSGMCEAGRIRHHLRNHLPDEKNTILIVGYQASHTLGRRLVRGDRSVRIFQDHVTVRAQVKSIQGYSGHGDQLDLLQQIVQMKDLKTVHIVHADPGSALAFKKLLNTVAPHLDVHIARRST